jgi:hypothetical protein
MSQTVMVILIFYEYHFLSEHTHSRKLNEVEGDNFDVEETPSQYRRCVPVSITNSTLATVKIVDCGLLGT